MQAITQTNPGVKVLLSLGQKVSAQYAGLRIVCCPKKRIGISIKYCNLTDCTKRVQLMFNEIFTPQIKTVVETRMSRGGVKFLKFELDCQLFDDHLNLIRMA
ncbi:unnamed protein product [Paramecium octaurelia]|uniref:Uncharacterized protein n=1 Tax=Paramecium octaurelia TaxID=43137 RepID=A0A8S1TQI6_PAROT|nr:unnamed protein product [Paramecium octaurelia]